jgi:hypothetical protein
MISFKQGTLVGSLLLFTACAQPGADSNTAAQAQTGKFNYAPAVGRPHHETMRRTEEVSIPGSPMRDAEQWTLDWDVTTSQEANLFKKSLKLVGLKINVNGADVLRGDEIKANSVVIDVLTDKDSNVVDVRGAEQLSAAIVGLGSPEVQPMLKRAFSPARMKALVVLRSIELHRDFVGRPSQVGSQWMANDEATGGTKQIRVVSESPCGANKCVQVSREYQLDRRALYQEISERVGAYVKSQGGDPSKVDVVGMDLKLEDSLLIDPASMDYHGARFNQEATIRVAGPNGELPVAFKVRRETDYKY